MKTIVRWLPVIVLSILFVFLSAAPINLTTTDLGRHLKNGELVFKNPKILSTNFYSYTNTDFPLVNHHWLSGVVFFWIKSTTGFTGLSLFYLNVSLITFILFYNLATKLGSRLAAIASALVFLPLLVTRTEIRPEVFTYLLSAIFLTLLVKRRYLFVLPVLELLWVNLHIYFIFGITLIGIFALAELINRRVNRELLLVFFLSVIATLFNPHGLKGALYPFVIFTNYNYPVLENQAFTKIISLGYNYPLSAYFVLALSALALSWFWAEKSLKAVPWALLTLGTSVLALLAIRNFPLFAYVGIVTVSRNLKKVSLPLLMVPIAILIVLVSKDLSLWVERPFGIGLSIGTEAGTQFFLKNNLKGPIFNNYDVGSYLIYYLYPKEKVFVDNRPEAYPNTFFTQTYIPMQEGAKWDEVDSIYHFQTIFFAKTDLTPWARTFLFHRQEDPHWQKVFDDNQAIIFTRKP